MVHVAEYKEVQNDIIYGKLRNTSVLGSCVYNSAQTSESMRFFLTMRILWVTPYHNTLHDII